MPVDHSTESAYPATDLAPEVPLDQDVLVAAVLAALVEPLVRRVAQTLTIDRMPEAGGSGRVPVAERARDCADVALSDVAHQLRAEGTRPIRGARLVHQHAARMAVSAVAKVLGEDGVGHELTRRVSAALWDQEVDRDHWAAAAQVRVHREALDPEPLAGIADRSPTSKEKT